MQTDSTAAPGGRAGAARGTGNGLGRVTASGGFLSFADYMEAVLYAPGLGYYSAGAQKFGAAGDFVTAPELGRVYAHCLARLAAAALRQLGGGVILEVGGGSGALAADLLLALATSPRALHVLDQRRPELTAAADLEASSGAVAQVAWRSTHCPRNHCKGS